MKNSTPTGQGWWRCQGLILPGHLWNFLGLDLSVLRAIYNLVQEKASRLHMWKGKKKTKE
jgi:hypothetical protein